MPIGTGSRPRPTPRPSGRGRSPKPRRDTVNFQTEAEANRQRKLAEAGAEAETIKAQADATAKKHEADGDAYAQRTVAEAEAKAINMRADALSEGNQALIAANKLIEMLPSLVAAAAEGIKGSTLTVLNGSDGVNEVLTGVVAQGLTIYDTLRNAVSATQRECERGCECRRRRSRWRCAQDRGRQRLVPRAQGRREALVCPPSRIPACRRPRGH